MHPYPIVVRQMYLQSWDVIIVGKNTGEWEITYLINLNKAVIRIRPFVRVEKRYLSNIHREDVSLLCRLFVTPLRRYNSFLGGHVYS